jgi:hypothetical protein
MDANRFDAWTRALPALGTRRAALRVLTGGGVAGVALLGHREDAAACRKAGKKCKKDKQCCSNKCKGKKCRCLPLQALCPDGGSSHVCCASQGTPACLPLTKPQCGAAEIRCLLQLDDLCTADCECYFDLVCAGGPEPHCCGAPGRVCGDGDNVYDAICCSQQCGCASPTGPCTCRNDGCQSSGETCTQTLQCCDGICQSGECCLPQGLACTGTAQCCAGLFCDAGFCDTP